jgi:hypothetical protein
MRKTPFKAAALACLIGSSPMFYPPTPADAGSVTVTVKPKGKSAKVVEKGLTILSKIQERRNRARVDQSGSGNTALVSQHGEGNTLGLFQRGSGHTAIASQDGDDNTLGIFQFGKNTTTDTSQTGNGRVELIFQGGW